jgi:uncharacterized protein YndB with AHSA1/START domain
MTADGGTGAAFHGEYQEIVPDERIVSMDRLEQAAISASGC